MILYSVVQYNNNSRCVASTHVTSFVSVQVHNKVQSLSRRPAGFCSEAAGALDVLVVS